MRGLLGPRSHSGRRAAESPHYGLPLLPPDFSTLPPRSIIPSTPFPVGTEKAVWGATCSEVRRRQAERYHPVQHGLPGYIYKPRPLPARPGGAPKCAANRRPSRKRHTVWPTKRPNGRRITPARSPGRSAVTDLGFRARKLRAGPAPPALRCGRLRLGGRAAEALA